MEIYFAAGLSGAILIPINFNLHPRDVSLRIRHANCRALIFDTEFLKLIETLDTDVLNSLKSYLWIINNSRSDIAESYEKLIQDGSHLNASQEISPEDILYIGYTSGTTGPSKGARISHRAVVVGYLYKALTYRLSNSVISYSPGPFWHSAPRDYASLAIYLGGTAIITPTFNSDEYLEIVDQYQVTCSFLVPTMLKMIMDSSKLETANLSSLDILLSGGSPLPSRLKHKIIERFGSRFHEFYGATETRMITTISGPEMLKYPNSVGRVFKDVQIKVVDDDGASCCPHRVGEVLINGPGMFSGYHANDDMNISQFQPANWFSLGDLGYLNEAGYLFLVDRKNDVIISGGENIYPSEIENLLGEVTGVREVAVIGIPDDKWIELVTAVIVLDEYSNVTVSQLAQACDSLPTYMKPRRFEFIDQLPRNATGKILRRELRQKYL